MRRDSSKLSQGLRSDRSFRVLAQFKVVSRRGMNLLLLTGEDFISENRALVRGSRCAELQKLHDLKAGVQIKVGVQGGLIGEGTVLSVNGDKLELEVSLHQQPPAKSPIILFVGLSRPQTIKKVIQAAVTLGVEELHFVRSELGEKSYLNAHILRSEELYKEVDLALCQAVDTVPPLIQVHPRFLPAIEDTLPERLRVKGWRSPVAIVADTRSSTVLTNQLWGAGGINEALLAIGPEPGWSEFEIQRLHAVGFKSISLGARILRVETAVGVLVAQARMLIR
jgi:16S rRNA (uracil1498-N3)-methyltransferase